MCKYPLKTSFLATTVYIRLHPLSSLSNVCTQLLRFSSISTVPNANHQSPVEVSPIIQIDFPCWNGEISCMDCTNLESRKSTGV